MKLLTKELLDKIPTLEAPEESDPTVWAKFFYPDFSWTWYVIAYDKKDEFFGLVDGDEKELGYFTLSELLTNKGKMGLGIERDMYFKPCKLSELQR